MDELELHRYMDGRLDESQRAAVEQALRSDPAARRTLDALREESRLLASALEVQVEPSHRISDKVIAQLHLEERSRAWTARNRRFAWRALKLVGLAAMVALVSLLVWPKNESGSLLSGTAASVVTRSEKRDVKRGQRIYDNDVLETAKGQFVRFGLAGGSFIDIDENSTLSMEKSGTLPIVRLTRGRIGVSVADGQRGVQIELPQGVVTVQDGSKADVWLAEPVSVKWPGLFSVSQAPAETTTASAAPSAVVSVFKGFAQIATIKGGATLNAQQGVRARVMQNEIQARPINLSGSRVLDLRGDDAIHARNNLTPPEWNLLGLMEKPQFKTLGTRWSLAGADNGQIENALAELDAAMQLTSHAERAEKIAAAQKVLHLACEPLSQNDALQRRALTLEGLAHFEEGRARAAAGGTKGSDPGAAFDAARDAFERALNLEKANVTTVNALDWQAAFASGASPAYVTMTPAQQAALAASFRHAAAQYLFAVGSSQITLDSEEAAKDSEGRHDKLKDAAKGFAELHEGLGRTVESVAAIYGEALCHKQLMDYESGAVRESERRKAIDALLLILSKPLANTDGAARQVSDGLRQAALLELVRLQGKGNEARKTLDAAHDFDILYPLDGNASVAKEIQAALLKGLQEQKAAAFKDKRFENAVEACDAQLIALDEADGHWMDAGQIEADGGVRHIGERMDLLEALVGAKDWTRAAGEAHVIRNAVPAELKARFDALQAQINAKK